MRAQRLQEIAEFINHQDVVSFSILCNRFKTSTATMRRDLRDLDQQGLIRRVHGGAHSVHNGKQHVFEAPYQRRLVLHVEEKKRIAKEALKLIHDNDVIILDATTTTCELANLLAMSNLKIMVITNDLYIGCLLQEHQNIELLMIGGLVRSSFYSTKGVFAEHMLDQLNADKLFMGADGVHPDNGIRIFHVDEINIKRRMLASSRERYLLCDHTKFTESAVLQVCPADEVNCIITDNKLDDDLIAPFEKYRDLKIIKA